MSAYVIVVRVEHRKKEEDEKKVKNKHNNECDGDHNNAS